MTLVESLSLSATRTVSSSVSGREEGRVKLTKSFTDFYQPPPVCFFMLIVALSHGEQKMV